MKCWDCKLGRNFRGWSDKNSLGLVWKSTKDTSLSARACFWMKSVGITNFPLKQEKISSLGKKRFILMTYVERGLNFKMRLQLCFKFKFFLWICNDASDIYNFPLTCIFEWIIASRSPHYSNRSHNHYHIAPKVRSTIFTSQFVQERKEIRINLK